MLLAAFLSGNTGLGEDKGFAGEARITGLGGVKREAFGDCWLLELRPGGGLGVLITFSANISKPNRLPELVLIDFRSFSFTLASASAILCLFFSDLSCLLLSEEDL